MGELEGKPQFIPDETYLSAEPKKETRGRKKISDYVKNLPKEERKAFSDHGNSEQCIRKDLYSMKTKGTFKPTEKALELRRKIRLRATIPDRIGAAINEIKSAENVNIKVKDIFKKHKISSDDLIRFGPEIDKALDFVETRVEKNFDKLFTKELAYAVKSQDKRLKLKDIALDNAEMALNKAIEVVEKTGNYKHIELILKTAGLLSDSFSDIALKQQQQKQAGTININNGGKLLIGWQTDSEDNSDIANHLDRSQRVIDVTPKKFIDIDEELDDIGGD